MEPGSTYWMSEDVCTRLRGQYQAVCLVQSSVQYRRKLACLVERKVACPRCGKKCFKSLLAGADQGKFQTSRS